VKAYKYILLLFVAALGSRITLAQNYVSDMEKISEKYKQGSISFRVKYSFYPYDSLNKIADSMNASCNMSNGEYYYKITSGNNTYEYVRNDNYYFVVDYSNKAIAVRRSSEAAQQVWDVKRMDSIMHSPSVKVTYKDAGNNQGEYDMKLVEGTWSHIKLVFDKATYALVRITMYSQQRGKMFGQNYSKPRIVIHYSNYSMVANDQNIFSESKYFNAMADNVTLAEGYKNYRLLNYLKKAY